MLSLYSRPLHRIYMQKIKLEIIDVWSFSVERSAILGMLKTVFSTLTVAMRYEPANAKFFETQVKFLKIRINQIILFIHVHVLSFDTDLNLFCTYTWLSTKGQYTVYYHN